MAPPVAITPEQKKHGIERQGWVKGGEWAFSSPLFFKNNYILDMQSGILSKFFIFTQDYTPAIPEDILLPDRSK